MVAAAVVWMHGLGDTSAGWSDLGRAFRMEFPHIQWDFPDAPVQAVSLSPGFKMPSWFDLDDLPVTPASRDDAKGMTTSVASIHARIERLEAAGIPSERIVVGGFSQGAALALHSVLRFPRPLGGVVMFSGWALQREQLPTLATDKNTKPNVLICHGTADDKVLFELGQQARDTLLGMGAKVEFNEYAGMGHSSCPAETNALKRWLAEHLPQ